MTNNTTNPDLIERIEQAGLLDPRSERYVVRIDPRNRAERRAAGQHTRRTGQATVRKSSRRRPNRRPIIMVP